MMKNGFASPIPYDDQAAVIVDYENLYHLLLEHGRQREHPEARILDLLGSLGPHLTDHCDTRPVVQIAVADFDALGSNGTAIQRALATREILPRFAPLDHGLQATQLQVCIEALDLLHHRPDLHTFVVVTGDRTYLPLLQQLRRYGRRVLLVAFEAFLTDTTHHVLDRNLLYDAQHLLQDTSRTAPAPPRQRVDRGGVPHHDQPQEDRPARLPYRSIDGDAALRTLEIIDEYFGQYEEVYLTPLLRKLSEVLDDEHYDPKTIISDLEEAGAVWLEKRKGFPYDYTVLLVDTEHPDVRQILDDMNRAAPHREETPYDEDAAPYDESEPYDEDAAPYDEEDDYSEDYADLDEV